MPIDALFLFERAPSELGDSQERGCNAETDDSFPAHHVPRLLAFPETFYDALFDDRLTRMKQLAKDQAHSSNDN